jgi:hypothetical protein
MKVFQVLASGIMAAGVLAAQGAGAAGRAKAKYDPNQMICESRQESGSRLKRIRVCHTALEWEDVRMQEKVGLMRKQYNGSPGAGATNVNDAPH